MNSKLQTIYRYHDETKHRRQRYAKSLGYMDWANQPYPYRTFNGAQKIALPLSVDNVTPPYHLLFDQSLPAAPIILESIAQLFQFSMGLAALKSIGEDNWAVRCNASSGNLHPTQSYLIAPPLEGQSSRSVIASYNPLAHGVDLLSSFDTPFWDQNPDGFIIGISSIGWREAWKYGERSFRYCQLDVGHAIKAFELSAKMLGWHTKIIAPVSHLDMSKLMGLDQEIRFFKEEPETADLLIFISPEILKKKLDLSTLIEALPMRFEGIANRLSRQHQDWPILAEIESATSDNYSEAIAMQTPISSIEPSFESKKVILQRRSVQAMDPDTSTLSFEHFSRLLERVKSDQGHTHLVFFIHSVTSLNPGIYIYLRNPEAKEALQQSLSSEFLWEQSAIDRLFFLRAGDFRATAKAISCNQDIASDSSFSLGMLSHFSSELNTYGPHRYKELYWECGAIGQMLYVEATSLNYAATGIGCFLDDEMHKLLGLTSLDFQILYHFTVGKGLIDSRIATLDPYAHLRP